MYQRCRRPGDWPRPETIVVREIDKTDGLLRNPFSLAPSVQYYIGHRNPILQYAVHNAFTVDGGR